MVKEGGANTGQVQPKARPSPAKKSASAKDVAPSKASPQRPSPTAVDDDIAGAVLDGAPVPSSPAKKKAKTAKVATSTTASTDDRKSAKAAPKRRRATSKKAMILEKAASEDADGDFQNASSPPTAAKSPTKKKSSSKTSKAPAKKKYAKSTGKGKGKKSKSKTAASSTSDDGKNSKKKRSWTKPKDKPKRPLSAYNLFFREEREKLLKDSSPPQAIGESASTAANGTSGDQSESTSSSTDPSPGQPAKRRHRKTHGKIGFAQLAQHIAAKWKALDADARKPYEKEAEVEKARYRVELEKWQMAQKAKQELLLQKTDQVHTDAQEEAALTLQALRANTPPPGGAVGAPSGGALPQEPSALPVPSADPMAALQGEVSQMESI